MNWLRRIIGRFDNWLSRVEGVQPFTDDLQCILRIQTGRIQHDLAFPDQNIPPGAPAVFLHFWNEHMPVIPESGADLAYGLRFRRQIAYSMRLVARHIQEHAALDDIRVVGGITTFVSSQAADGGRATFQHLGFTLFPYPRREGAFGEFWENFYGWWLMWTYNPVSARYRKMRDMQHREFWMTRQEFLRRYAAD